jgi:nicotinamide-nucleotide amidase
VADAAEKVRAVLGSSFIFSEDPEESLEQAVHRLLLESGATVAVAESCTGGLLAAHLTSQSGSSTYFQGGIVAYQNEVKERELGVPADDLKQHGAVSHQVVAAMAEGTRRKFRVNYALSVSGVAGPTGGTDDKPVGTFFVGIASPDMVATRHCLYVNVRGTIQRYAAAVALDILRRTLLKTELPDTYPCRYNA